MIDLFIEQIHKDKDRILKFISDNSLLKKGVYIVVDIDTPFTSDDNHKYILVTKDAKSRVDYICDLPLKDRECLIDYVCLRDSYSGLLDDASNKTVDGAKKKVLSTNYLSLGFSNKFSPLSASKEKNKFTTLDELVAYMEDGFFGNFLKFGKKIEVTFKQKKEKTQDVKEKVDLANSETRLESINKCALYCKENLVRIIEYVSSIGISNDDLIKIFFTSSSGGLDDSAKNYEDEYSLYLMNYLFNKGTIVTDGDMIRGGVTYGYNNNGSKPCVKPRTMNIELVKSHTLEEALDVKLAFELLRLVCKKNSFSTVAFDNVSIEDVFSLDMDRFKNIHRDGNSLFYNLHYKDKYVQDYDLRAEYTRMDNINCKKSISCIDYLGHRNEPLKIGKDNLSTINISRLLALLNNVDVKDLNKYTVEYNFTASFFRETGVEMCKTNSEVVFRKYQHIIHSFLMDKNVEEAVINRVINNYTDECISVFADSMFASDFYLRDLAKFYNIKLNLIKYFKGECELLSLIDLMNNKLVDCKDRDIRLVFENDAEYYYALGQLAYYIETKKKTNNLDHGIFKFYTDYQQLEGPKTYLESRYEVYGYAISAYDKAFNNVYSAILDYKPTTSIKKNKDAFYIGVCSKNFFYIKQEEIDNSEE